MTRCSNAVRAKKHLIRRRSCAATGHYAGSNGGTKKCSSPRSGLLQHDPGILLILVPHEPSEPALGSGKRAGGRCRRSDSRASMTITTNSHRRQRRHSHGAVSVCGRTHTWEDRSSRTFTISSRRRRHPGRVDQVREFSGSWRTGPPGRGLIVNDTQDLYRFFDRLRDPKERCGRSGILALCVNTPAPQTGSVYLELILWPKESKGRGSK